MVIYTFAGFKLHIELLINFKFALFFFLAYEFEQSRPSFKSSNNDGEIFFWFNVESWATMGFWGSKRARTRVNEESEKMFKNINFHLIIFGTEKGNKKFNFFSFFFMVSNLSRESISNLAFCMFDNLLSSDFYVWIDSLW